MSTAYEAYINGIATYLGLAIYTFGAMVFLSVWEALLKWKVWPEGYQKGLGTILSLFLCGALGMVFFKLSFWAAFVFSVIVVVLLSIVQEHLLKRLKG